MKPRWGGRHRPEGTPFPLFLFPVSEERIFIELMTSGRKLEASRKGSKWSQGGTQSHFADLRTHLGRAHVVQRDLRSRLVRLARLALLLAALGRRIDQ